ncbi:MAG: hypothetical protein ABR526_02075 [Chthoniobacterales bacterium]
MKSFLAIFQLTVPEQRTAIALLLAFVGIVAAKKYHNSASATAAHATVVQPSPSPGTRP